MSKVKSDLRLVSRHRIKTFIGLSSNQILQSWQHMTTSIVREGVSVIGLWTSFSTRANPASPLRDATSIWSVNRDSMHMSCHPDNARVIRASANRFLQPIVLRNNPMTTSDASDQPIVMRLDTNQARLERLRNPNLSTCGRCCRPWSTVKGHTTEMDDHTGVFPLCESCWGCLTPEKRLPYYLDLIASWKASFGSSPYTEEQVTRAVMSESA